jgi:hypothetical protein
MAQIIRHRKGVLESVNGSTKRKAELLIVTGSSGITATNSSAMVFFGDGTDATAANKVLYGTSTPDLTGNDYGNSVDGIPYYNTSQNKLYILAKAGNIEVQSTANTGGTGIMSGSEQVANALNTDNRNINLGSGTLTTTGISNLGVISGSSMDLTGNANIQGNITLGGNITIGDASSDTIAFGGDLSTDIIPNANNTLDLGSATDKFAEVHATTLFGAINATNGVVSGSSQITDGSGIVSGSTQLDGTTIGSTSNSSFIGTFTGIVNASNGVVSGSSQVFSDVSGDITIASNGTAAIESGVIVNDDINASAAIAHTKLNFDGSDIISGSAQLLNVATDFGTGRVSGEDIGDLAGTSTITGSFVGDGAGLTGLATDLQVSDGSSSNLLDLQNDAIRIVPVANETTVDLYSVGALKGWTVGIADNPTLTGNVTVTGNFEVQGTQTIVDSTTVQISDNILELNGAGSANGGLLVKDAIGGSTTSGSLLWDTTNDYWKAGKAGSESQILTSGGNFGLISGSSQVIDINNTAGVISGSSQVFSDVSGDITIASNGTAAIESGVIVNDDVNASAAIAYTKLNLEGSGIMSGSSQILGGSDVVSGSSQVTTEAAASEILIKHASNGSIDGASVYSLPATSTIAINDSTPTSAGANGELIINGTTSGFSGILTQDLGGSTVFQQYATSGDGLMNFIASSGYGFEFRADNTAGKSWQIDSDGDFVAQGNLDVYAYRGVFTNDISGSNLKLTGDANIDGNIVLGGNITLGDSDGDSINFSGELATDIIPDVNNSVDLGSSSKKFSEIHGTLVNATTFKAASGDVISGSAQLLNVATDFGSGRVSGEDIGDLAGTSTFTGSFVGDGSGISGLSTDLSVSGSDGSNDTVALLNGALTFAGGTGVSTAVATDTVTISVQDGSTSAKGIASFSSTNFGVSSGNVTLISGNGVDSSGGVLGANLNADTAGDGLSYSLSNQQLDVDYGSSANNAVEGNTTISVTGTANEVEITGTTAQALGGGASYTIGLPDDVTIGNDLTITADASVGGNMTVTGNLSVLGSTTTIDSTTVNIGDNILELNYGGAQTTAGLQVTDSTGGATVSGSLIWNGTNDNWTAGALGSEKELARLNASPTTNTVLKADSNGLLVDSVLTDDGTDATFSGDVIVDGLTASSFLYADASKTLTAIAPTQAGDLIQWDGSSFVASNALDGGTF